MAEFETKVTGLFLGQDPKSLVTTKYDRLYTDYGGLDNGGMSRDRHFGLTKTVGGRELQYRGGIEIFNTRQISAASDADLQEIAKNLGLENLPAELLGLNLTVAGMLGFTHLPPMTTLLFPEDAGILLLGENEPCIGPGEVIHQYHPEIKANAFPKAAKGYRGVIGIVERNGAININDPVRVLTPREKKFFYPGKK